MPHPSRQQYLESKVLTASQPQLHLMLLDGALRFGRQAQTIWSAGHQYVEVETLLEKMSNIVDELAHGTASGSETVSKQLEEQYAFIYRELATSRVNQDLAKLSSCLELLTYQRETWKLAIDRFEAETTTTAPAAPAITPHMNVAAAQSTQPVTGFSFEA